MPSDTLAVAMPLPAAILAIVSGYDQQNYIQHNWHA